MAYVPNSGSVVAFQGNPSVLQAVVAVTNFPANPSISGTVIVSGLQGASVSGQVGASVIGHAPVVIVGGSVAASFTPPANQSVSGTVQAELLSTNASVITVGSPVANQSVSGAVSISNFPVTQNVSGSVVVFGFPTNQNVSGSVVAFINGTVPVNAAGSVVAFQGTNPWVVQSIVGTYAEDSAHTSADKGLFILGVRNDTVASFAGANGEYNPFGHDSAGRVLGKPFAPEEARIEGYNSVVSTSVTTLVAAAGAGLKNYITDIVLANTGAITTLVTFRSGGGTSVLGYGIAPAGGGSNMIGFATPLRTLANETFDFQATASSSILFAKVSGYKAP